MAKVIAVTNRKGGVGKTTVSVHLAAGLATRGYRIGLVDTDSQGHLAVMLGADVMADTKNNPYEFDSLYRLMTKRKSLSDEVIRIIPEAYSSESMPSAGELFLIRSRELTSSISRDLDPAADVFVFFELMQDFIEQYQLDCVIVDTSPSLTELDGYIYLGVDEFIYVTELEQLSFQGLMDALKQIERYRPVRKRLQLDIQILGVIPNKVRANTVAHQENLSDLQSMFGTSPNLIWEPLPLRMAWVEASQLHQPMFVYSPTSGEASDAWQLVNRVEQGVKA